MAAGYALPGSRRRTVGSGAPRQLCEAPIRLRFTLPELSSNDVRDFSWLRFQFL